MNNYETSRLSAIVVTSWEAQAFKLPLSILRNILLQHFASWSYFFRMKGTLSTSYICSRRQLIFCVRALMILTWLYLKNGLNPFTYSREKSLQRSECGYWNFQKRLDKLRPTQNRSFCIHEMSPQYEVSKNVCSSGDPRAQFWDTRKRKRWW